jgi:hypothetical protein
MFSVRNIKFLICTLKLIRSKFRFFLKLAFFFSLLKFYFALVSKKASIDKAFKIFFGAVEKIEINITFYSGNSVFFGNLPKCPVTIWFRSVINNP